MSRLHAPVLALKRFEAQTQPDLIAPLLHQQHLYTVETEAIPTIATQYRQRYIQGMMYII